MKSLYLTVAGLLLAVLCGCESTGKLYPSDLSVEQLEMRMRKASDPDQILFNASTFVQQQIVTEKSIFGDTDYEIHAKYKAPDKLLLKTLYRNQPFSSMIFNGEAAWITDYRKKTVRQLTGETLRKVQMFSQLSLPSVSYRELFREIDISICVLDDREYYLLKCVSELDGVFPLYVYVDKNTFLVHMVRGRFEIDSSEFTLNCDYESVVEEYRAVLSADAKLPDAKLILPAVIRRAQDSRVSDCRLTFFKLDVPVDNADFLPEFFSDREYGEDF